MAKKTSATKAAEFIESLNMNGLEGRMLYLPASPRKKRNILFIYGHHSRLEWWYEYAKLLNRYGSVTVPDLPGFGGMEPLGKIHERPTLNNLADYLAAFIKLRYKKRNQITIVAAGFGFVVVTRTLQRYPDIAKRVDMLVSLNGFTHADDLKLSSRQRRRLTFKNRLRFFCPPLTRQLFYGKNSLNNINRRKRLVNKYSAENLLLFNHSADEDAQLWRQNSVSTHASAIRTMLKLDNCIKRVDLPVWHVPFSWSYLDSHNVEQHMRVTFRDFHVLKPRSSKKALPTSVNFSEFLPAKLRRELAKVPD